MSLVLQEVVFILGLLAAVAILYDLMVLGFFIGVLLGKFKILEFRVVGIIRIIYRYSNLLGNSVHVDPTAHNSHVIRLSTKSSCVCFMHCAQNLVNLVKANPLSTLLLQSLLDSYPLCIGLKLSHLFMHSSAEIPSRLSSVLFLLKEVCCLLGVRER